MKSPRASALPAAKYYYRPPGAQFLRDLVNRTAGFWGISTANA
ncbi:MAG: hypothetical protein WA071_16560 [Undibacterium umbellatum]